MRRPNKPCLTCHKPTRNRPTYCGDPCEQPVKKDTRQLSARERGYNSNWEKFRLAILHRDAWTCQECDKICDGHKEAHVDHIIPHRGDPTLMWDPENCQTLCASCHSAKTGRGE